MKLIVVKAAFVKLLVVKLISAVGYSRPKDTLAGREQEIHGDGDRRLAAAQRQRQFRRQQAA